MDLFPFVLVMLKCGNVEGDYLIKTNNRQGLLIRFELTLGPFTILPLFVLQKQTNFSVISRRKLNSIRI